MKVVSADWLVLKCFLIKSMIFVKSLIKFYFEVTELLCFILPKECDTDGEITLVFVYLFLLFD